MKVTKVFVFPNTADGPDSQDFVDVHPVDGDGMPFYFSGSMLPFVIDVPEGSVLDEGIYGQRVVGGEYALAYVGGANGFYQAGAFHDPMADYWFGFQIGIAVATVYACLKLTRVLRVGPIFRD